MQTTLYKVIWPEYENTEEKSNWLPVLELAHTSDLISNFHQTYPSKPGFFPLPQL